MKLYLSSYRLGNNPEKLMELFSDNKNVAVIANAMDFVGNSEREESVRNSMVELENLRLLPEEVDLRNYFNNQKGLIKKLNNYGAVYVRGGNTFVLKRAMAQSSFDKWIKNKTKDPNFVYAGYSAGICILSPTLHGLELVDDPSIIPEGYNSEIDWNGLNLVNFSFAPHYKSDHPESGMVDREVEYFIKHKMPFKTLRDGEVLIM
ncbi:MAG: Type 1 glutamine amidotransferase-like domain-containing protein [Candidatus Levybacteria bacterium]|nr:Type 1 glutamine amidotransferase-like domain-containing protein [Candidatus Levybacteria bacterium]